MRAVDGAVGVRQGQPVPPDATLYKTLLLQFPKEPTDRTGKAREVNICWYEVCGKLSGDISGFYRRYLGAFHNEMRDLESG